MRKLIVTLIGMALYRWLMSPSRSNDDETREAGRGNNGDGGKRPEAKA